MALLMMILGSPGRGKTASLRGFGEKDIELIKCIDKKLPFRGVRFKSVSVEADAARIVARMQASDKPVIAIDDADAILENAIWGKLTDNSQGTLKEIAADFQMMLEAARELPDEKIVVLMAHTDRDSKGAESFRLPGGMEKFLQPEALADIVLKSCCRDGRYYFSTTNSGRDTVKSPAGMLEARFIENDLAAVIRQACAWYGIPCQIDGRAAPKIPTLPAFPPEQTIQPIQPIQQIPAQMPEQKSQQTPPTQAAQNPHQTPDAPAYAHQPQASQPASTSERKVHTRRRKIV